tara:strand:- start:322 stop:519 length:198 start_codon:yes stop_codon:yes gene_type:complete
MKIMEEREEVYNEYWNNKMTFSKAFFSLVYANNSRSNNTSGTPGNILATGNPALAFSGKREQRVL